jgi:hypothetical protein
VCRVAAIQPAVKTQRGGRETRDYSSDAYRGRISYLKDRYQKVVIDDMKTYNSTSCGRKIVKHGVAQGSVLGPLFFLSEVTNSNARIILYADGTNVILSNPGLRGFELNMNTAVVDINEWFKTSMLSLNLKKKLIIYNLGLKLCGKEYKYGR